MLLKPIIAQVIKEKAELFMPVISYYYRRARLKYNFSAALGEQGSGKSYFSIFLALTQDPFFTNQSIVYGPINFLDMLDELEKRVWKGRVIIWDDAGVGLPSSEWYSVSNKVISIIMQTVRTLHPSIIFTMPDMSYLDPKQRRVITSEFECSRTSENITRVKVYTIKRVFITGENYTRRFRFSAGPAVIKLGYVNIKHAKEDVLPDIFKEYEKTQAKFKFATRQKLRKLLEGGKSLKLTDAVADFSTITLNDMEKELIYDVYKRFFSAAPKYLDVKRKVDKEKLMLSFKISEKIAKQISKFWNKKMTPEMVAKELEINLKRNKNK